MEETEELRQFREQWKREVRTRIAKEHSAGATTDDSPGSSSSKAASVPILTSHQSSSTQVLPIESLPTYQNANSRRQTAIDCYSQAIGLEEQGAHDEALTLYRRAFRLDGNVDRAYHRLTMERQIGGLVNDVGDLSLVAHPPSISTNASKGKFPPAQVSSHARSVSPKAERRLKESAVKPYSSNRMLNNLFSMQPSSQLRFDPELETEPVHLNKLPDELLLLVLHSIMQAGDTKGLERFATVSKKARFITLEQGLWRYLVQRTYVAPQLLCDPYMILHLHGDDYRQFYIHQPRVRLDGVYIAVCHYVRTGHSENAWVNITHLITYHRYLRFLPDGTVLSFLSSDSTSSPQQIIPLLNLANAGAIGLGHKVKGMSVGRWKLYYGGDVEGNEDDTDHELLKGGPYISIDGLLDSNPTASVTPKYSFSMRLGLRSKPIGRWNKLDILRYSSIHIDTDEETPLPLKHERPYWFSKVKSYGTGLG
ncbi:hypothetical protein FRC17_000231 [Serendipita sp. 399]|nr:hypothetical protein FRC17_000231 [Serendipita sp. 399]